MALFHQVSCSELNAIEDRIDILARGDAGGSGALKLCVDGEIYRTAEHERAIHAAAWEFDSNNTTVGTLAASGYRSGVSGASILYAPLDFLEVGDRITYAEIYYSPQSFAMQPALKRLDLATGTVTAIWTGSSDNSGSAIESQNSGALAHTVLAGSTYFLEISHSNAASRTYGGRIRYSRPAPSAAPTPPGPWPSAP